MIYSIKKGILVLLFLSMTQIVRAQHTVWLDDLDLKVATVGHGNPEANKSVSGKPLTIAGQVYKRGFGTHAESTLFIELDGKAKNSRHSLD
ncbi:hypothetical protein J2X77_003412 [Sphingobacterium sp. 2149]|nr:hypothetical protein [Sphingobacterium sp. 2149]